jgi:hypothetical protein
MLDGSVFSVAAICPNADVTLNVYTQVLGASLRTAVDRIGDELFTIVHGPKAGSELNR